MRYGLLIFAAYNPVMIDTGLLDRIYAAAALPGRMPVLLHEIATCHGARGALLFESRSANDGISVSPGVEHLFERYVAEGYMALNERGTPMFLEHAPQFRTDSDFRTPEEQRAMPVYRDLLIPLGFAVGAGTVIQGTGDDMIGLTLEGFADDAAARQQLPRLDRLRPHIARATSLATRMMCFQSEAAVDALGLVGTAAAIIGANNRLRAMNAPFGTRMEDRCFECGGRLRFRSPAVAARVEAAVDEALRGGQPAATLLTSGVDAAEPLALHVIPLRTAARERFESDGILLIVADPRNAVTPKASLLRLMFDLTPGESMLAAELAAGHSLRNAAARRGVAYSTARVYLRQIFAKTGCHRQAELATLLTSTLIAAQPPG